MPIIIAVYLLRVYLKASIKHLLKTKMIYYIDNVTLIELAG